MTYEFTSEVRFSVPPERVFGAIVDVDTWREWMKNFVRAELLTPGPLRVGTQIRETRKMFGKEASEVFEVTRYDPPRALGLFVDGSKGATGKGEFRFDYEFVPDGSGTLVRMHGEITLHGFFAKLFGKMFLGFMRKACDKDLTSLRDYLEKSR